MNILRLIFSPTGGTQRAADDLCAPWAAQDLSRRDVDLTDPDGSFDPLPLGDAEGVLIAIPSYGGRVPAEAIERAVEYVRRQHNVGEGSFVYQLGGESYAVTLTGAGILCLELCGRHNDPYSRRAVNYLMRAYPELLRQNNRSYGMYYTAQGLFQLGGEGWKVFEDWMYRTWIPRQRENGSWVEEENSAPYNTSLLVLAFTVPYRQLPIYQRDETVDED